MLKMKEKLALQIPQLPLPMFAFRLRRPQLNTESYYAFGGTGSSPQNVKKSEQILEEIESQKH